MGLCTIFPPYLILYKHTRKTISVQDVFGPDFTAWLSSKNTVRRTLGARRDAPLPIEQGTIQYLFSGWSSAAAGRLDRNANP